MSCIQCQSPSLRISDSSILIDEPSVCHDTAYDRVCITRVSAYTSKRLYRDIVLGTHNPATATLSPVPYKRQNFLTHCALVKVANADTGGGFSVTLMSFSSIMIAAGFSVLIAQEGCQKQVILR
jgi:hypothetical protein